VSGVIDRTMLRVESLAFSYPGRHVLAGWSADFAAGLTWLHGPNGCGKSTLLKLIGGAIAPLAGRCVVAGIAMDEQPIAYRREVFWCGSGPPAFEHLRITEYLGFMRGLYPCFDEALAQQHLQGFGLLPFADRRIATLSAGTQRKAWLVAAFAAGTSAVLIDEPFNALDGASARWLRNRLGDAARQRARAWLVASHEPIQAGDEAVREIALGAPSALGLARAQAGGS
jgi:ABC-type multidrug transport system ATPase subunit